MKKLLPHILCLAACAALTLSYACRVESGHAHSFGEWQIITPATCTTDGEERQFCDCGEYNSRKINALGHDWSEWENTATEHSRHCKRTDCGEIQEGAHEFGNSNRCGVCGYSFEFTSNLIYSHVSDSYGTGYSVDGFEEGKSAEQLIIPAEHDGEPVTEIGESAFNGNTDISYLQLPSSLKAIRQQAFEGCSSLAVCALPQDLEAIEDSAFGGTSVVSAVVPDSVTELGESVFANNAKLRSVTIGAGVTGNVKYLFEDCTTLNSVLIKSGNANINNYNHSYDGVPAGQIDLIFDDGITELKGEYGSPAIKSVKLGAGITAIPDYLFGGYPNVAEFDIPEGVLSIGKTAFSGWTGLKQLHLPKSLHKIDLGAFRDVKLEKLYYAGSIEDWLAIDRSSFNGYSSPLNSQAGTEFYAAGEKIEEITLNCETVPQYAFHGHSFKKITLGENVRDVEECALLGAKTTIVLLSKEIWFAADLSSKSIDKIYFKGTVDEMRQGVKAGAINTPFFRGVTYYFYSDVFCDDAVSPEYDWLFGGYWRYDKQKITIWEG